MNKTLKTLFYILGVCVLLFGFGACASNKPKPEQKPESVKPADSEKNEEQVKTARLLDEMAKARAEAVNVKADTTYPTQFKSADDTAAEARKSYESNNLAEAQEKAQRATDQYRTLTNRMKISELKSKIDKNNFAAYDADSYKKAQDLSAKIPGLYEPDPAKAFETSEEALGYYEKVKEAGFASMMNDAKKKADEARSRADSVKADERSVCKNGESLSCSRNRCRQ